MPCSITRRNQQEQQPDVMSVWRNRQKTIAVVKMSQATGIASPLPHLPVNRWVLVASFPRDGAKSAKKRRRKNPPLEEADFRGKGGVICGLI
jgi:hypothetical protein